MGRQLEHTSLGVQGEVSGGMQTPGGTELGNTRVNMARCANRLHTYACKYKYVHSHR